MEPVYFEDFQVGERFELGTHVFTKEEILRFAREFDPQPFHVDEARAVQSPFGGLIASGWHTASVAMRLLVDGFVQRTRTLGSPGVDSIRWTVPVRPGDTVRLVATVVETKASQKRDDRGTIWLEETLFNQRDEVVMVKKSMGIIARRPKSSP